MSKSSKKVKKKYADTYKWTNDEVELLLTVTKEYKTKQITKRTNWDELRMRLVNKSCQEIINGNIDDHAKNIPKDLFCLSFGTQFDV